MQGSYKVRIHGIETRKNKAGKTTSYRVSWNVDGEDFKESFKLFSQADSFRSSLLTAARNGEQFSRMPPGLPLSFARSEPGPTWYVFAMSYVDAKWPYASPNHRRGICESLSDATEVLLSGRHGIPDRSQVRAAMLWACSARLQNANAETPPSLASTIAWLTDNTVRMTRFTEPKDGPALVRSVLDRICKLQDGKLAAASTSTRKRVILNNLMEFAVEGHVIPHNPLRGIKLARPKKSEEVDVRTVVNTDQARRFFDAMGSLPNMGPRLVAFFGCMYYAALRPEEVIGLHRAALTSLPKKGWGEATLAEAEPEPGARWTSNGKARERRELKHRAVGSIRVVPLHPDLVAMLRSHLERFPNTTQYVFRGPRGGAISDSAYLPYFHRARAEAFTSAEASSPLAAVPYALRHAAVSTWLNAGVPGTQVAEWAGHSVEVLYRVYAKCIAGQDAEAKRRILEATSPGTDERAEDAKDGEEPDEESPDEP